MPQVDVPRVRGLCDTVSYANEPVPAMSHSIRLTITHGMDAGRRWRQEGDRWAIGTHPSNEVVLTDRTVSRFHCEVRLTAQGARIRDLGSTNGTFVDGARITEAFLRDGSTIRVGGVVARVQMTADLHGATWPPAPARFGSLVAVSNSMRNVFAVLERAASSHASVLVEGETGTGKTQVAESIHRGSARSGAPFITLDCSAVQANLLESELFGHERGAFTGAADRRLGVFEEAAGGTIFLDEIGELPLDLQPKLLRVLENREIRRVGSNTARPVDVRVIAATNRDLRSEVNAGRFRSDLYFRLAVIKVAVPPLRERPEDILPLAEHLLSSLEASAADIARVLTPAFRERIRTASWPGNVRELRNTLERALVLHDLAHEDARDRPAPVVVAAPVPEGDEPASGADVDSQRGRASIPPPSDSQGDRASIPPVSSGRLQQPLSEARQQAIDGFERDYLQQLLTEHGWRVSQAARTAGISRVYLYKLLERHGLKK